MITLFKYLIFSDFPFTNKAKLDLNISPVPVGSQCSIPGQDILGFDSVYVRRYSLCKLNTLSNKPVHEISNNLVCATSKVSDQLAHTRSLIRALASRLSIL